MNTQTQKKRGRPAGYRAENPHTERLSVNVTAEQLTTYKTSAEAAGLKFSQWVRNALDKAARSPRANSGRSAGSEKPKGKE